MYVRDALYPGRLGEIGYSGYMRDQAVVQVLVYPLQVNPVTGEARFYRHLRVRVTFDASAQAQAVRAADGFYGILPEAYEVMWLKCYLPMIRR